MRVLVTGAAGFSGRAIARALVAEGHDVIAHHRDSALPDDLARLETWKADLAGDDRLPKALDAIVHSAATSPPTGAAHAVSTATMIRDNALATARLTAADAGVFIYLSSLSIHGTVTESVVTPDTLVVEPDSYGMTKLLGERAVAERGGTSLAIRLPAVIGAGAARNWPVQTLAKLRAGETVRIFNADSPFNNVVHVLDVAAFVATVLATPPDAFTAVPVASQAPIRVRDVVVALAAGAGITPRVEEMVRAKTGFTIDIAQAMSLGFAPRETAAALMDYAREETH